MAALLEMKVPAKLAQKGVVFRDWTLDGQSIEDNCQRLAKEFTASKKAPVSPNAILEASKVAITDLGRVTSSHRAVMDALRSRGIKYP